MKPFLIKKKGGPERYSRLRQQHEQKHRDVKIYVHLLDIILEVGNLLVRLEGSKTSLCRGISVYLWLDSSRSQG